MPRKTADLSGAPDSMLEASMRPRPDAAENPGSGTDEYLRRFVLQ